MDDEREIKERATIGIMVISTICGLWLVFGLLIAFSGDFSAKWGQVGDSFGVLNSVFSGVALLGAVYSIILQRKDFLETIKAHKETSKAQVIMAQIQAVTTQIELARYHLGELRERIEDFNDYKEKYLILFTNLELGSGAGVVPFTVTYRSHATQLGSIEIFKARTFMLLELKIDKNQSLSAVNLKLNNHFNDAYEHLQTQSKHYHVSLEDLSEELDSLRMSLKKENQSY